MFYCYMNDKIVSQSSLFCLIKKCGLCFTLQHTLPVFPCIVLPISLRVDHELGSTLHTIYSATFIFTHLCW